MGLIFQARVGISPGPSPFLEDSVVDSGWLMRELRSVLVCAPASVRVCECIVNTSVHMGIRCVWVNTWKSV